MQKELSPLEYALKLLEILDQSQLDQISVTLKNLEISKKAAVNTNRLKTLKTFVS